MNQEIPKPEGKKLTPEESFLRCVRDLNNGNVPPPDALLRYIFIKVGESKTITDDTKRKLLYNLAFEGKKELAKELAQKYSIEGL